MLTGESYENADSDSVDLGYGLKSYISNQLFWTISSAGLQTTL